MSRRRRAIDPAAARRIRFSLAGWILGAVVVCAISAADHGYARALETLAAFAIGGGLVTALMVLASIDPPREPDTHPVPPRSSTTS